MGQPPSEPQYLTEGLAAEAPDAQELARAAEMDDVVPAFGFSKQFMVGIGGSAGSIPALIEFLKAMPAHTGMTFVFVLHLSRSHESALPELLSRATSMPVLQPTDGMPAEPDHVYVIPPGKNLAAVDDRFHLSEMAGERGRRVTIDHFFRSLADTHGPNAIAIVLSGADGDGSIGIRRIKERGGLTIVQDPGEAQQPDMPRSALDTGMVDCVMRVEQIPTRLVSYVRTRGQLRLPPEQPPEPGTPPDQLVTVADDEAALRDVLQYLRVRTGRDFAYYKRATILRRIARRMQVNCLAELPAYLAFLRTHPGEAGALLQDLLISVTNFFRDREVFAALETHIPQLFEGKGRGDTVRVWAPACASGEEAYSLAILLLEHARTRDNSPALQVFACDLDEDAIRTARAGQYTEAIAADVSEDRLRSFFVKEEKSYRVQREVREMVLFATHDLLKDAPFSRMDLISCRNLLIYLTRDAQRRALDVFHYALRPGGLLLLGASESVEDESPRFRVVDKKYRIYAHQSLSRTAQPTPGDSAALLRALLGDGAPPAPPVIHGRKFIAEGMPDSHTQLGAGLDRAALAELHFKLIERYAPPSIVINGQYDIVHMSEQAGQFLRLAGGPPTLNLLKLVHPGLRINLRAALFRAAESGVPVEMKAGPIETADAPATVRITVAPAAEISPGFLLIVLRRDPDPADSSLGGAVTMLTEPADSELERELEQTRLTLRETVEKYEGSTEELKASNEELQAINEELRTATEELETSREELQSINEELTTVNQEIKSRMEEVACANSDLQNLMASTAIATVFLDRELAITRFTPSATDIFNIIPTDVGRPLAHLTHRLDYPELIADAQQVLHRLLPIEREVGDGTHWYLARIQPYRTVDNHIGGAVLTLVDVTERNRAVEAMRQSEERLRILIESVDGYAILTLDRDGRVDGWNRGAEALFGYAESEVLGQSSDSLLLPEGVAAGLVSRDIQRALDNGRMEYERWHRRKDGTLFYGAGSLTPLRSKDGQLRGFVEIMHDLTERKSRDEQLEQNLQDLTRFNLVAVGREDRMIELKAEVNELCARLGQPPRYAPDRDGDALQANEPPA